MMTLRKVVLVVYIGLLASCEQQVSFDIAREPPRLAVYAIINPDSLVSVWVTQTKSVADQTPIRAIRNAEVTVAPEGQSPERLTLQDRQRGEYQAGFAPQAGTTYHLTVAAEGLPPAEAITQVPKPVPIQSVAYRTSYMNRPSPCPEWDDNCDSVITRYRIDLTLEDPAEENYYEVMSFVQYLEEREEYDFLTEEVSTVIDTVVYSPNQRSNDPVITSVDELLINPPYTSNQELKFSDELFNGRAYTLTYAFESDKTNIDQLTLLLRTYHPEAYAYLRAKKVQQQDGGSSLSEPVQIPQNIQGGYGIFSSYSEDTVTIRLR